MQGEDPREDVGWVFSSSARDTGRRASRAPFGVEGRALSGGLPIREKKLKAAICSQPASSLSVTIAPFVPWLVPAWRAAGAGPVRSTLAGWLVARNVDIL